MRMRSMTCLSLATVSSSCVLLAQPAHAQVSVEQTTQGSRPAARLVASFDGLGFGFAGPHGASPTRNPSDNSLAVGRDHIMQTVNSRMAIFTKKGKLFDTTGRVLYGAVPTNTVFKGFGGGIFGGSCERSGSNEGSKGNWYEGSGKCSASACKSSKLIGGVACRRDTNECTFVLKTGLCPPHGPND